MQNQRSTNGNNGDGNGNGQLPDLTNREILKVLLEEIGDVRKELKGEIGDVRKELKGDMRDLKTEIGSLRMEVHQNQITFMKNHDDLEKRVTVLEAERDQ